MHRKIVEQAVFTGQYPVAILSDRVVYAAEDDSPLDFLPHGDGKPLPGGFELGIDPGLVKLEGTQQKLRLPRFALTEPSDVQRPRAGQRMTPAWCPMW